MSQEEDYTLKGIKKIDGVFHIPLIELLTLCRKYPKITGEQINALIGEGYKRLEKDVERMKSIPVIETTKQETTKKQSIIAKLFTRSAPDASSQKT